MVPTGAIFKGTNNEMTITMMNRIHLLKVLEANNWERNLYKKKIYLGLKEQLTRKMLKALVECGSYIQSLSCLRRVIVFAISSMTPVDAKSSWGKYSTFLNPFHPKNQTTYLKT